MIPPNVPAGPVREHVRQLRQSGVFVSTIVAETGVSKSVVDRLLAEKTAEVRPRIASALLAMQPGPADTGSVWADPQAAHEHVDRLYEAGMSYAAIARQTGVCEASVSWVGQGRAHKISRDTERKLLSVVLPAAESARGARKSRGPMGLSDSAPVLDRITELRSAGLLMREIAHRSKISEGSVKRIASGRTRQVAAETARRILAVDVPAGNARACVDLAEVQARISRLRTDGATISEVADRFDVSPCTVLEIESGRRKQVGNSVAERLLAALRTFS